MRHNFAIIRELWFWHEDNHSGRVTLRFARKQFFYNPQLSAKLRARTLLFTMLSQALIVIGTFNVAVMLTAGTTWCVVYQVVPRTPHKGELLFAIIDFSMITINAFRVIQQLLFFDFILNLIALVYVFHYNGVIRRFAELLHVVQTRTPASTIEEEEKWENLTEQLRRDTLDLYRSYQRGALDGIFADRAIASGLTFWGSVSNFTYNIYVIAAINFMPMTKFELAGNLALIALQSGSVCVASSSFLALAKTINRPGRLFLGVPRCLEGSANRRLKIAMMSLVRYNVQYRINQL